MKLFLSAYIICFMFLAPGCLGGAPKWVRYDISYPNSTIKIEDFLESFNEFLEGNKYSVEIISPNDQKTEKYTISDGVGQYPVLLEAKKGFGFTIVRVCKKDSKNYFIQIVQLASIIIWDREKRLEMESKSIKEVISSKYPYLRIELIENHF